MKLSGNTILITGGSSGIGMALAERFLKRGNEVSYGFSSETSQLSRPGIDETFQKINGNFKF